MLYALIDLSLLLLLGVLIGLLGRVNEPYKHKARHAKW